MIHELLHSQTAADPRDTCKIAAENTTEKLLEIGRRHESAPDDPGMRINGLFAKLYYLDNGRWQERVSDQPNPEFFRLFSAHFLACYIEGVDGHAPGQIDGPSDRWAQYRELAAKLTMRSSMLGHFRLIVVAVRTHIQRDIATALQQAYESHVALFGYPPDMAECRELFFDPSNVKLFQQILLEFMAHHRTRQLGYRRHVLFMLAGLLRLTRPLWGRVLSGWRIRSWRRFEAECL